MRRTHTELIAFYAAFYYLNYGCVATASMLSRLRSAPPHAWFGVSAVFHYLGPSFAVLLFPRVGVLGVAWLRIATSILTVLSGWQLRRARPDMPRAFRIPGGNAGLAYAVAAPVVMSAVALLASDRFGLIWGPVVLVLGVAAYGVFRRRVPAS